MNKVFKISTALIAAAIAAGCTAQPQSDAEQKSYLEMNKAEQAVAINSLVKAFNQAEVKAPQNALVQTAHHANATESKIYSIGTYQKHVPKKDLREMRRSFSKLIADANICTRDKVVEINKLGVSYQAIMVDMSGKNIFESKVCRGVKSEASAKRARR